MRAGGCSGGGRGSGNAGGIAAVGGEACTVASAYLRAGRGGGGGRACVSVVSRWQQQRIPPEVRCGSGGSGAAASGRDGGGVDGG